VKNFSALAAILLTYIAPTEPRREAYNKAEKAMDTLFDEEAAAIDGAGTPAQFAVAVNSFADCIGLLLPTATPEATIALRAVNDYRMTINLILTGKSGYNDATKAAAGVRHALRIAINTAITFEPTLRA